MPVRVESVFADESCLAWENGLTMGSILCEHCTGHCCKYVALPLDRPKTRRDFWVPKLEGNAARDLRKMLALAEAGWTSLVVWQCELRDRESTVQRIIDFLDG